MEFLLQRLTSEPALHLAAALLHSLWQGLFVAGILCAVLRLVPVRRHNLRYAVALGALVATVLLFSGTWAVLNYSVPGGGEPPAVVSESQGAPAAGEQPRHQRPEKPSTTAANDNATRMRTTALPWQVWLTALWLAGVFVMLGRAGYTISSAGRLRQHAEPLPSSVAGPLDLADLSRRIRLKRSVRVLVSEAVRMPAVAGTLFPAVLLPLGIVSPPLPPDQLRMIVAHELAHIRRYDHLVTVMQSVIEALFFFNPATWWISRQIRLEREACCDAEAVAATGQRLAYAEVLVSVARRSRTPQRLPEPQTALADSGRNTLSERVRRLLTPGRGPRMTLPWLGAILVLLSTVAALYGLHAGTAAAVEAAAELMSPQERVEKITEIAETHSGEYLGETPGNRITVSGSVSTWDGKPVPEKAGIFVKTLGPHNSREIHFSLAKDGTFRQRIQCNKNVLVGIEAPGYAPGFTKTFHPQPGDHIDDVEIVLEEGFTGTVRVLDKAGEPISNARLTKRFFMERRTGWSGYGESDTVYSDAEGVAQFRHCIGRPVRIDVWARGFQPLERLETTLNTDHAVTLKMKKGLKASGIVVAKKTGQTVEGAELRLVRKEEPGHSWSYGSDGKEIGCVADSRGRFTLNTLQPGMKYAYLVTAGDYNDCTLAGVEPGDMNLRVEMLPVLKIQGTIVGNLDRMRRGHIKGRRERIPYMRYESGFSDGRHMHTYRATGRLGVEIIDGVGHFMLSNIVGDRVILRPAGTAKKTTLHLQGKSLNGVVIDLDKPGNFPSLPTREVVLNFEAPADHPPVEGEVTLWYMTRVVSESDRRQWSGIDVTIEDGVGSAHFPANAYLRLADTDSLKGFWIDPDPWLTRKCSFVAASDEPFRRTIEAEPAGSIFGTILDGAGRRLDYAKLELIVVKRPERYMDEENFFWIKRKMQFQPSKNVTETGRFHTPALPLEGTYAVLAQNGTTWLASAPIRLTAETPIRETTLQPKETKAISGNVLFPNGTPASEAEAQLNISVRYSKEGRYGKSLQPIPAQEDGSFMFRDINTEKPLSYEVTILPPKGYQPIRAEVRPGRRKTFRLKRGYTLKGRLLEEQTDWPIPGTHVHAEPVHRRNPPRAVRSSHAVTDKSGNFLFTSLAKEQYRLYVLGVELKSLSSEGRSVVVTGGEDAFVILKGRIKESSKLEPQRPEEAGQ